MRKIGHLTRGADLVMSIAWGRNTRRSWRLSALEYGILATFLVVVVTDCCRAAGL